MEDRKLQFKKVSEESYKDIAPLYRCNDTLYNAFKRFIFTRFR